jgi:Diacylglycerol kinase
MASNDNKRWKNVTFISSLEFALAGITTAFKEERNLKFHFLAGILVLLAGLIFRVSKIDWFFLLLSIFMMISAELVNSAIENVVDLASDYHFSMLAKKAKDMAAGAVLVISIFAIIVGLMVFVPKIIELFIKLFT